MNDLVKDTLKKLMKEHGESLCSDVNRLKGLLYDACPSCRKEINVLILAGQEGLIAELKKVGLSEVYLHSLSSRLHNATGIDKALAEWSIKAWAEALGLGVPSTEQALILPLYYLGARGMVARDIEEKNKQAKIAALREKLIPIVQQAMSRYKGEADIAKPNAQYHGGKSAEELLEQAAECAIALRDRKAAARLLSKMKNYSSILSWQGKKLTILLEDEDRAKVFEEICGPDSWAYEDVALFAAKVSDGTTAKRILRGLEEKRGVACAVVVAIEIGNKETIARYIHDHQMDRKEDLGFYRFPIKLAQSHPELAKRKMKYYEDMGYWRDVGDIAAVLGDIPTAKRAISKLKEKRLYESAGTVAAILGDPGTAELMMWESKKENEYDFNQRYYSSIPSQAAPYNPEAAYHLMQALEKQEYDVGLIAAKILQSVYEAAPDKQMKSTGTESQQKGNLEERLVYLSDFYFPSDKWIEKTTSDVRIFRQDGYYHIAIYRSSYGHYCYPGIPIADFSVHVDAEFATNSGKTAECGVVFRLRRDNNKDSYYRFSISRSGYYALYIYINNECTSSLLNYRFSEFIRRDDSTNSLIVEMVGQKITLGLNGHILATVMDSKLADGNVGLLVAASTKDSLSEARFRDFRLYSI